MQNEIEQKKTKRDMNTNKLKNIKWIILVLLVFCRCANDMPIVENDTSVVKNDPPIVDSEDNPAIFSGACFPEVSDKYVYPVVPGMKEWQQLKSMDDAYQLCQLPDDILKSISTQGLIDALIRTPLFTGLDLISSNSSVLKWYAHYDQLNSARELFQREDAGAALVAYYKLVDCDCLVNLSGVGTYLEYERMMGLEILFTKQEILATMGHDKKKEAVTALLANYEQYDSWHVLVSMAHIMLADKYAPIVQYAQDYPEEFQCTLEGHSYPSNPNQWNIIISQAKDFIFGDKVIGDSAPPL